MRTVYGPVPSWRFGRSLGIDAVVGAKVCNFNCVYCQLGKTLRHVATPEDLEDPVTSHDIAQDLENQITELDIDSVDVITFSGSGEPTLNPNLGEMVDLARDLSGGKLPLVLLTNSSLLCREEVREAVAKFDVVCAKVDAGDQTTFRTINRPMGDVPDLSRLFESLTRLKASLQGKLMTQTMFLRTTFGFTNATGETLEHIVQAVARIDPDVVQIDTPYRPGGEGFVKHLDVESLKRVAERFEENFTKDRMWAFGMHDMRGRGVSWRQHESILQDMLELIRRRPCRVVDLADSLGLSYRHTLDHASTLLERGLVSEREFDGERYLYVSDLQSCANG
jgi:wyosine [tRNA(Phe)-imidazoG37] synthetase (radical SAM superfamily)